MDKKPIARLSDREREVCRDVIKRLKGSSQKVRRAQTPLKADAVAPLGPTALDSPSTENEAD